MSGIEIRPIDSREELEQCFDLWGEVFAQHETRDFFARRLDCDTSYRMETTWIAKVDGVIASAVQIFPYDIRLDSETLTLAGIGSVATHPNYRGRGLAQEILHAQNSYLRANGTDLGLLFSGVGEKFYAEVGYRGIPGSFRRIKREEWSGQRTGVSLQSQLGKVSFGEASEQDLSGIRAVYDTYNEGVAGSAVRSRDYWENQFKWRLERTSNFFVAKQNDSVVAYFRVQNRNGVSRIVESAYDEGHGQTLLCLFDAFVASGCSEAVLEWQVTPDHPLYDVGESVADQGVMWRYFNFTRLMQKLAPVWQHRLQGERKNHRILLRVESDAVLLSFDHAGNVTVDAALGSVSYDEIVRLSKATFLAHLIHGSADNSLFPEQKSAFWWSDYF